MGMVVVFAIIVLLIVLTATAAVFYRLNLTDPRQPLGLPEGSVRALIALFLIMVFIIMSAYLFRTIAGRPGVLLPNLTAAEVAGLSGQAYDVAQNKAGTFDLTLRVGVPAAAEQLALQLVTILATLVTAVSAFYFGSANVRTAFASLTQGGAPPTVVDPSVVRSTGSPQVTAVGSAPATSPAPTTPSQGGASPTVADPSVVTSTGSPQVTAVGSAPATSPAPTTPSQGGAPPTPPMKAVSFVVDSISPPQAPAGQVVAIELTGTGFVSGIIVKLAQTGTTVPDIDSKVTFVDASKIKCAFDLPVKSSGQWDVVAINPDASRATKYRALQIT